MLDIGWRQMFKRYCFFLSLLILVTASQLSSAAQKSVDFSKLERTATQELRETNTPGVAIAIISGDRIVFVKTLGVSSVLGRMIIYLQSRAEFSLTRIWDTTWRDSSSKK